MPAPRLDWSTATVKDAKLTVELEGKPPSGWKQGFATTVRLLGSGEWGEVTLKKKTVRVKGVVDGEEERLRHFLDSVVDQANASHPSEPDQAKDEAGTAAESEDAKGPDAEMTARFRAFAEPEAETRSPTASSQPALIERSDVRDGRGLAPLRIRRRCRGARGTSCSSLLGRRTTISPGAVSSSQATSSGLKPGLAWAAAAMTIRS